MNGVVPLGVQLYSLRREMDRDVDATLQRVADLGFLGVETAGLHCLTAAELRRRLDDLGLAWISAFTGLPDDGALSGEALEMAAAGGVDRLVVNAWPEHFATADAVDRLADSFRRAAAQADATGIALGYHNHFWELQPSAAGPCPLARFTTQIEHGFLELDIYWLSAAATVPLATLAGLGLPIELIHVKDGPCTMPSADWSDLDPMTPAGTGRVDVEALLHAVPRAAWHIVEFDNYAGEMFEGIAASRDYLVGRGLSHAR